MVGAGYWGPNLVRNYVQSDDCDVRWICDLDSDRAETLARRFGVARWTRSLADVLGDANVQGVAVATPARTHAAIADACLDAGKDVLIEKPLATSVEQGRALVAKAEQTERIVMTDHTFCYTETVRHLRSVIRSGEIGEFRYYDSVRINLGLIQSDVNVIWDLGPHDLSILDFILPVDIEPVVVTAQGSDPLGVGHACIAYVAIEMSDGSLAHLHLNWLSPVKVRTILIGGSEKMMVWDDMRPAQRLSIYDASARLQDLPDSRRREALASYRIGDMVAPAISEKEALVRVVTEFTQSIRTRQPPATDGHAGLRVLELLDAAGRSLEAGGVPVRLGELGLQ